MGLDILPGVKCAKCGYDMSALERAERCPECGAPDWPSDRDHPPWGIAERACVGASLLPVSFLLLLHVMLLVARVQLGRWPSRGGMDDPTTIPWVSSLHALGRVVLFGLLPTLGATFAVIAGLFIHANRNRHSFRNPALALAVSASAWATCILLLWLDPAQVFVWFLD